VEEPLRLRATKHINRIAARTRFQHKNIDFFFGQKRLRNGCT
jgi:hypothetical protein